VGGGGGVFGGPGRPPPPPPTTMLLRACAHLCPDVSSKRLTSPHAPAIVTLVMKQAIRSDEFYAYFTPLVLSAGVVVRD